MLEKLGSGWERVAEQGEGTPGLWGQESRRRPLRRPGLRTEGVASPLPPCGGAEPAELMEKRAAHSPGFQETESPKLVVASLRLHLSARDGAALRSSCLRESVTERRGAGPSAGSSGSPAGGVRGSGRRGGAPTAGSSLEAAE